MQKQQQQAAPKPPSYTVSFVAVELQEPIGWVEIPMKHVNAELGRDAHLCQIK